MNYIMLGLASAYCVALVVLRLRENRRSFRGSVLLVMLRRAIKEADTTAGQIRLLGYSAADMTKVMTALTRAMVEYRVQEEWEKGL